MKTNTNNNKENKYDFVFSIGDRVKVLDLNIKGKISSIRIYTGGTEYEVIYFYECKRNYCYFEAGELELCKGEEVGLGFKKG